MEAGDDTLANEADTRSIALDHLAAYREQEALDCAPFDARGHRVGEHRRKRSGLPAVHASTMGQARQNASGKC